MIMFWTAVLVISLLLYVLLDGSTRCRHSVRPDADASTGRP